jgi:Mrp family chromosome partitioning ATPase
VIFDTPPVLLFSDAIGLAPSCDGTMLVARADQTDGRALDHAASLLRDVQADLIGCVLNRYDASSSFLQSYGYGYGYGYDYGYAYGYRRLSEYYDENREQERNGPLGWVRKKMKG